MVILIEGEYYDIDDLQKIFEDINFYTPHGSKGKIKSVGYYHSFEKNSLVLMLPKVFMKDAEKTSILDLSPQEIFSQKTDSLKHKPQYNWVRQLSLYFYNSLKEFKSRFPDSVLINYSETFELRNKSSYKEYSYLDILLSLINFYKKNKSIISFTHIQSVSNKIKKTKWEKTIRKSLPLKIDDNKFLYPEVINKNKTADQGEDLIIYFLSIINYLSEQHSLNISIEKYYPIIKGQRFQTLQKNGLSKLRKIKYKYYSDLYKNMYRLCELYFSIFDSADIKKRKQDYIVTNTYNIIFEDMIDKLFSDDLNQIKGSDGLSLSDLKNNEDGKKIDHIFDYESLIDTSNIFYIGDSKYYKTNRTADGLSRYKQFTYAKNIIQYNINLLNEDKSYSPDIRYRDPLTEGYNITPNFFIYGYIDNPENYNLNELIPVGEPYESRHFTHRLFDRDTLYVHQYKINFLYVLKSYTSYTTVNYKDFRESVKELFRNHFVKYFQDNEENGYTFYEIKVDDFERFVNDNFRLLNGKSYVTKDNKLIIAKHRFDDSLDELLRNNEHIAFSFKS
ncbi:hypothetical protein [Chryseobacterium sp.]|uniref:hypothetical protein n=1 Tax=Chryseobacterium sp. TaxID=1871047 RepID=UPI000EEFB323|nr:hypothetical protein [Chryseobacterium sp.]HCM34395.1 hypothetical protein [Chryseobacterium sp.]